MACRCAPTRAASPRGWGPTGGGKTAPGGEVRGGRPPAPGPGVGAGRHPPAAPPRGGAPGASVILTTHHMDEAERLADRVAIVDHGRLVADGTPAELTGTAGQLRFRAEPGLDTDGLLAALSPGAAAKESPAGHYLVEVHDRVDPQLVAAVTAWCAEHGVLAQDLRIESRTLEDVFLQLTGRELRS